MTTTDIDTLTTAQVAQAAGVSTRQLDYLVSAGVIDPAWIEGTGGSGSRRRWAPEQVKVVRLAAVLRELGATDETLRPALAAIVTIPDERVWNARILVTVDGRLMTPLGADANGYLVDLARCRDYAEFGVLTAVG